MRIRNQLRNSFLGVHSFVSSPGFYIKKNGLVFSLLTIICLSVSVLKKS